MLYKFNLWHLLIHVSNVRFNNILATPMLSNLFLSTLLGQYKLSGTRIANLLQSLTIMHRKHYITPGDIVFSIHLYHYYTCHTVRVARY